ncbi:toll-like receptor 6 [Neodiprion pinetum]|uniref:Toll-like receptor 6 n=1 Tax=Neodiprion lecontei TaxID=441921 RepID=A0ABM3FWG4_NEOLC|nr:toll-like receptor 6 [Neodiprion fabricii]XP_046420531.1 toll-like receptor 6 [Neodiprion fabricii]XP_046420532.1 toll-like receptor 6 [Neodiprion fabricii]XP_046476888.1 toll-like receptor 6 [Neodiprion pinetum]XP_046476889.1 toll-like receptor 6 [Neodiprion pinetum]XP_046476890.1 toll-like receptor 6 [Neodiprion pinetum]XP_046592348.1 toll-like receptor 6 [Neodiprion lecontei]XP_046592349.1 toll-like receptor 6 [Neodiprion lecontei]XP_046592350.1 toll-like receptor 6 [Neodiprion lecont
MREIVMKMMLFWVIRILVSYNTAVCFALFVGEAAAEPLRYAAPEDCAWHSHNSEDEVSLTCSLRSINSEFDTTNFSLIPSEHTAVLKIECDTSIQTKSSLSEDSFAHLHKLRELHLDGCKLANWPAGALNGLRNLRNLAIRTRNNDYPAFSLELFPDAFAVTPHIEKLDLASNNIWSFPDRLFCPLSALVYLNVSGNRLQDVTELNFRETSEPQPQSLVADSEEPPTSSTSCSLDIQILDVSSNHLIVLPSKGFSTLRRLKELRLARNEINMVDDKALFGLRSLEIFDLSDNRVVALPAELFRDTANTIKEIHLQNNSLSVLAPGLFADLKQLVALYLSRNSLTSAWFSSTTFSGLIRLVLLDLSRNKIATLDPALFKDLYTVQILNLQNNKLETIPADTFSPMSNLHTLVLKNNRLTYLDAYSLNGLFALSLLALDSNHIEGIHPDAFRNCSSLRDLNLSGNNLDSIPAALKDMRMLRTIDLGENQIKRLVDPGFKGMSSLYGLRLIGNEIANVTKAAFAEMPALQILNLARNKIERVESGAFGESPALQAVRLDANFIRDMSGIFMNAPGLLWLNMSDNAIEHFDYTLLPRELQWLDMHKNKISDLGVAPPGLRIQTLDASFNRITKIPANSLPESIELLFLNDNLIHSVEPHTFVAKVNLTRVDLYANQIVSMELSALQLAPVPPDRALPEFYVGGNPFQCDCTMEWLQRINALTLRQHPKVMDLASVYCRLPYDRRKSFAPLLEASPSQFLCTYKTHCFALCHCCDFDACDCEMTCPTNCTCYHDQSWSANVVDCSRSGYTNLPGRLPMDATEVYLDGNEFGELTSHAFIGRKNLQVLYANNSNIVSIHNHTFSGLKRLVVLHLENNKIITLRGLELAALAGLKELYLQNNLLVHIDNGTFLPLRELEVLRLENNRLTTFAVWQLAQNPYLVDIGLVNNPWSCECGYLGRFREWVSVHKAKITDLARVSCALGSPLGIHGNSSVINCAALSGATPAIETRPLEGYLPLLLASAALFFALIGLVCGALRHRQTLRAWAAGRCGLRACYKTAAFEESDRPFDAYISYSAKDEAFVSRSLAPGLEMSYRLCLHYRDLGSGSSVADAVNEAADSSRRTILVLSRNFIHGEWARFEFKAALRSILRDKGRSVIFLLVGGVSPQDLDSDLRKRIASHTVVAWGEKLFWQKLRFAMPDPPASLVTLDRGLPPPPLPPPPHHLWA